MIADTEHVVAYLLKHLNKQRLFALGHSWGSFPGMELARRHPEWLHAYIGTGQMIDTQRSEAEAYEFALQQARIDKNAKALRELKALAPIRADRNAHGQPHRRAAYVGHLLRRPYLPTAKLRLRLGRVEVLARSIRIAISGLPIKAASSL